jgi:hypothetical protein
MNTHQTSSYKPPVTQDGNPETQQPPKLQSIGEGEGDGWKFID